MKHISWDQVAHIAMQYGPDFVRRIKERIQPRSTTENEETAAVDPLSERIRELERMLITQDEIIQQHNRTIELLEQNGKTLQARLNIFMTMTVISAVLSLAVLIFLLGK